MILGELFGSFLRQSPICVMQRALLENVFATQRLDEVFRNSAVRQYERELLFSQLVELTGMVVCRIQPSVHAAYKHKREQMPVTIKAVYDKLGQVEAQTSQALVRHTAIQTSVLIDEMKGARPRLLPGFRVRILDGNHLAATDRRLKVVRGMRAGALPGQALVLLDPQRMVIDEVFPCEDGHAQERSLLPQVLPCLRPRDLILDDRNFCTVGFLMGMDQRQVCFITRQHANTPYRLVGRKRFIGRSPTGRVYEQALVIQDRDTGQELTLRRISVRLKKPTRDGDTEIHLLTNLPAEQADALLVASLYHKRWTLETAFQELTTHLRCELNTLGYPKAALFAFCVAVSCYNLLAALKGALRSAHGAATIEETLSNFYLTEEISGVYRGMMIALPPPEWTLFQTMPKEQLAEQLRTWAEQIDLDRYAKAVRGPKKPVRARRNGGKRHVATAHLLPKKRPIVRTSRPDASEIGA
jgi:hypothetical protein